MRPQIPHFRMKALLLTSIIALSPLAVADITTGSPAPAAQEYTQLAQEVVAVVTRLTDVLESVKDKASADAAAPQISSITTRMLELQRQAENMPSPGNEVEQLVRSNMDLQHVQQVVARFLNAFIQLAMNNAYGSEALLNALGPVMSSMPSIQE